MRIGFMAGHDRERIEFMRKHGFGSVELMPSDEMLPPSEGWKDAAAACKQDFEDAGIRISCLGGFYSNHMDPAKEAMMKQRTRGCIDLAEFLGVATVAGFSGRLVAKELEESLPLFREIWGEHAYYAADRGIKIAFEHCPLGRFFLTVGGANMMCTPDIWEKAFNEVPRDNIGLEWDPSHLVCMMIDPLDNLRRFGSRVFHVHAKDAHVNWDIVRRDGLCAPSAVEHCFPGLGDSNWGLIIKELRRQGYDGDLNIEGHHDSVFRDQTEDLGLVIALRHMQQFCE